MTQHVQVVQGSMNRLGERRVGIVGVGRDGDRAWVKLMVIGGPSQADARLDQGVPVTFDGIGRVTLTGIVRESDEAARRGAVIELRIDADDAAAQPGETTPRT